MSSTGRITAILRPANATNKGVVWSSSNQAVAMVDQNGNVTPQGLGNTVITATTQERGLTDTCMVAVTNEGGGGAITGARIDPSYAQGPGGAGTPLKFTAVISPPDAPINSLVWELSDHLAYIESGQGTSTVFIDTSEGSVDGELLLRINGEIMASAGFTLVIN